MSKFEIGMYIELDARTNMKDLYVQKGVYSFNVGKVVIYPIGTPIPIIRKNDGCLGIGTVTSYTVNANGTKVTFELDEISYEAKKVFYNTYRAAGTMNQSNDGDIYDNQDMVIPGAMSFNPNPDTAKKAKKAARIRSIDDLMDFADDDY